MVFDEEMSGKKFLQNRSTEMKGVAATFKSQGSCGIEVLSVFNRKIQKECGRNENFSKLCERGK